MKNILIIFLVISIPVLMYTYLDGGWLTVSLLGAYFATAASEYILCRKLKKGVK